MLSTDTNSNNPNPMNKPTEVIFRPDGRIYHLNLLPDEIADVVILTGDPGRIDAFSKLLDTIEAERHNREYRTVTGTYRGRRVSFLSTGIGVDNVEIACIEMDALARMRTPSPRYRWVRVGTSGTLHADVRPGHLVLSRYAIGLDNLSTFYPAPRTKDERIYEGAVKSYFIRKRVGAWPYLISGDSTLFSRLRPLADHEGITVCAPGFFAPQGREIAIAHPFRGLPDRLMDFEWEGLRILNFEMEVSALYLMGRLLGHSAAVMDVIIANRASGETLLDYSDRMRDAVKGILDLLAKG